MPRTEEQFKEIRVAKRNQIMDSALSLFAEKGFSATSINMIAKKTGISKGLVYNYFESKEELIKTILINGFNEFLIVFDTNKDGILTKEEFIEFIKQTFDILKTDTTFWRLYFVVMSQPDVFALIENEVMELIVPLILILESYYKSKGVKNPMAHARLIGAMLDGISLNYIMDPKSFPLEEIKEIIINKIV
jgi:AcrR family transcriptional regulator